MEFLGHWMCLSSLVAAAAKLLQSCPTLCDSIDGSPPGSPVPGILQARTLEWVAISFSNAWKWKVKVNWLSRVRLFATPWTVAHQVPPSMGFSRQKYWSGVPSLVRHCQISSQSSSLSLYSQQWGMQIPFVPLLYVLGNTWHFPVLKSLPIWWLCSFLPVLSIGNSVYIFSGHSLSSSGK